MKFSNLGGGEHAALKVEGPSSGMEKQHLSQNFEGARGEQQKKRAIGHRKEEWPRVIRSSVFIAENSGSLLVKACLWG